MYKFEYLISYKAHKGFEYSLGWIILIFKKVLQVCIWNLFIQTFLSPIDFPRETISSFLGEHSCVNAAIILRMLIKFFNRI